MDVEPAAKPSNGKKRKAEDEPVEENRETKRNAITDGEANTKVYVRGLPWKATEDEVKEFFVGCGSGPISVKLPLMDDGRSSGTAIVGFSSEADAALAIDMNGATFGERWLSIKYSSEKPQTGLREPSAKQDGCLTVFIGNLSWNIDEDTVRETFGGCGEITEVRFSMDRETGDFKGYGHIEFAETEATDAAVALAGTDIMGRQVRVDFANQRTGGFGGGGGRPSFGGGGGRGRGRGGGRGGGRGRGGRGGRGGGRGDSGFRGGRGGGRGDSGFKSKRNGSIASFSGKKITFD